MPSKQTIKWERPFPKTYQAHINGRVWEIGGTDHLEFYGCRWWVGHRGWESKETRFHTLAEAKSYVAAEAAKEAERKAPEAEG